MGLYGDYYKKYYSDVKAKKVGPEYHSNRYIPGGGNRSEGSKISSFPIMINIFGKGYMVIFTVQAIIVLILILGVIGSKMYPSNQVVQTVYTKAMYYMDNGVLADNAELKEKAINMFNEIKSVLPFDEKHELEVFNNYSLPVGMDKVNKHEVIDDQLILTMKKDAGVKPSSSGTVKSIDKGESMSVLIDHGNGYEMKYSGFGDVLVNKGEIVTTDNVIGNTTEDDQNIIIEVYYMGGRLNPSNCFSFKEV